MEELTCDLLPGSVPWIHSKQCIWAQIEAEPLFLSSLDKRRNKVHFTSNAPRKQPSYTIVAESSRPQMSLLLPRAELNPPIFCQSYFQIKMNSLWPSKTKPKSEKQKINWVSISRGLLNPKMFLKTTKNLQKIPSHISSLRKIRGKLRHFILKVHRPLNSCFNKSKLSLH